MTQEQLKTYKSLKRKVTQAREQIIILRDLSKFPKNQVITGMPMHHDFDKDGIGKVIVKIEALEERYTELLEQLIDEQTKVEECISTLSHSEQEIIRMKYFEGKTYREIGKIVHYSDRHVRRIIVAALKKIENS